MLLQVTLKLLHQMCLISGDIAIPVTTNAWIAIFVLPINSAINPLLYSLNSVMIYWQKKKSKKRANTLRAQIRSEISSWPQAEVQRVIQICLNSKKIDVQTLTKEFELQ